MTTDNRTQFLLADIEERKRLVAEDPELSELLGDSTLARFQALPDVDADVLSAKPNPNALFVPGVMGSVLSPHGLGGVWWLDVRTRGELNRLRLSSDGQDDGELNIDVKAVAVDYSYSEFMAMALANEHLSIRPFPYDWRKNLRNNVDALVARVGELRAENGGRPVHLLGHSMGGLMIRTALAERPELWDQVGRIVYMGTPHFGATAIASYLKNHLWGTELLALLSFHLRRDTFQTLRGPIGLLPAPADVYPKDPDEEHPCADFDLYDADSYELSFESTSERDAFQDRLTEAADTWRWLADDYKHNHTGERLERQLMIAGVGQETLFRLEDRVFRDKRLREREPGNPHRDGDGRVPLASALLPGMTTAYVNGVHGELPNIEAVAQAAFSWVNDGAVNGHLPDNADDALGGTLSSSVVKSESLFSYDVDPEKMSEADRAALLKRLEAGEVSNFEITKIL